MSGSITGPDGQVLLLAVQFEEKVSQGVCAVAPIIDAIDAIVAQVSEFGDHALGTEFVIELMTGQSTQSPESIRTGMIDYDTKGYLTRRLATLRQG